VLQSILLAQADDFVRKSGFGNEGLFMEALQAVANNLGFPSKHTHTSLGSSRAQQLFTLLRNWHLVIEIEQKGLNSTSRFLPKRYLYDLGMAQLVRNMPFPKLSTLTTTSTVLRSQLGGVFENLALIQLGSSQAGFLDISGWKKNASDGVEVDFVWRQTDLIPLEVKATRKVSLRNFSSLLTFLELSELSTGVLISTCPYLEFKRDGKRLINLPIYLLGSYELGSLTSK
jgi:hypothetical protein